MEALLREIFVVERDLAPDRVLERHGGHLARHVLAGLARPLVEAPRLARRDDRDLVLVAAGGRNQGSKLHRCDPPRSPGGSQGRARRRRTRERSASTMAVRFATADSRSSLITR